jgi:hypothetical protein
MEHNLVRFNLSDVRLDLSGNGVDHTRHDCQHLEKYSTCFRVLSLSRFVFVLVSTKVSVLPTLLSSDLIPLRQMMDDGLSSKTQWLIPSANFSSRNVTSFALGESQDSRKYIHTYKRRDKYKKKHHSIENSSLWPLVCLHPRSVCPSKAPKLICCPIIHQKVVGTYEGCR